MATNDTDRDHGNPQAGCANACDQHDGSTTMSATAIHTKSVMALLSCFQ